MGNDQLDRMERRLIKIETLLTGNGTPDRGMIVRLDRLEQLAATHKWVVRTIAGSFMALAVSGVATAAVFVVRALQ